jgi:MSHA biogenesis protein MshQ
MSRETRLILWGLAALALSAAAEAATCTSRASGNWNSTATWTCTGTPVVTRPGATDTAVIASPNTVTLNNSISVGSLTVNAGGTLADGGRTLTITGNLTNNGTISGGGDMDVTGNASVISGNGAYTDSRLYTSGTAPTIAAGAVLNFSGNSRIYTGRTAGGNNFLSSVLTINGTINSTVTTATTTFLRLYANSTVIGSTGIVNASVSAVEYKRSTAALTNNGSVSVNRITQNSASNAWTQGTNSSLTVTAVSTVGTLTASATGNTVTYTSPATPITPSGNTYYNLAGTGVTCPHGFTVLGSDPCAAAPGTTTVTMNPGSCVNATGIGTVAWAPSPTTNVNASDNLYATATVNGTTNYLKCTGYNFSIPSTATILGVVVNVERNSSSTSRTTDGAMRLVKAGVIGTVDRSTTTTWTTTDVVQAHGASNDLWGTTWTPADINSATFGAAFAAKTTRSRTVSVDHMPVSVTYSTPTVALHHIQIEHDGTGQTCAPEQLTVKACADAACTSNYTTAAISGNVTWAGAPGGSIPFSIASGGTGQTTVSLAVTTAQTVTLGTSSVSPTPTTGSGCTNLGGGSACSMTFTSSSLCMDAVEVGAAVGTPIYTKLSGTGFSLDVRTVSGANYTGTVNVELVDASAGTCAAYTQLGTQNVTFSNQKVKTVAFNYARAAKSAKVRMTAGATSPSCSSDKFVIRPMSLAVTSSANADGTGASATATPVVKAGASFTLTATAVAGYNGTPTVDSAQLAAHTGAVASGLLGGTFGAANAATGAATGNAFTYGEVGYFRFNVNGVNDKTFADIDRLNGDCTLDYSNALVGGKYGCYFGNSAATSYFGRFIPDHFDTVVTDECGVFTYSGQPFTLVVQAMDAAGATLLQNYDGTFAKGLALSDALNAALLGSFNPAVVLAGDFVQGAATVTPAYAFANVRTAPAIIGVRATEAAGGDGVSSATGTEGQANIRSGRVWMGNAYGSELLNLPVPVFAQFWNGTSFVTNVADDVAATCTSVPVPAVTLQPGGTAVAATMNPDPVTPGQGAFVAGTPGLVLAAPGVAGSAVVTLTVPAWLQYDWAGAGAVNPSAQITFGVYRGKDVFIYRGRRGR